MAMMIDNNSGNDHNAPIVVYVIDMFDYIYMNFSAACVCIYIYVYIYKMTR